MNHTDRISSDNLNILLVDDEEIVLNATREYLTRYYSFEVDIAESVGQALDKISAGTYDAIIADYEMEKASGLDLLSAIRQKGDQTPFIVFTGKGREEVVIASFELGADGYVQKGGEIRSQFAELAQKVRTVVQGKRAASALRDQNERHRILFETMEQGVIYLDRMGRVIEANPAAAYILKIPHQELIGSFLHDDRLKFFDEQKSPLEPDDQPFLRSLYTRKSESAVLGITHPPAHEFRWIHVRTTPLVREGEAEPFQVYSLISDITRERMVKEQTALQAERISVLLTLNRLAEKSHEELFEYAIDACLNITQSQYSFISLVNEDETRVTIHAWSPSVIQHCSVQNKTKVFQVTDSGIWAEVIRTRSPLILNEYPDTDISNKRFPDGHVAISRMMEVPIFDKEHIVAILAVANKAGYYDENDVEALIALGNELWGILHKKEMQDALHLKNYAIKSSISGIALADLSGSITYVNPAFLSIWGYHTQDQVIGKNAVSFWREPAQAAEVINTIISSGRWQGEMNAERADGTEAALLVSAHTIHDESGKPLALMASFIDITDKKRNEIELIRANNLIEGMLNGIKDIVGLQLPDHTIIRYNKAGYEALGMSQYEIAGKKCYELIGRRRPCEICATSEAIARGKPVTIQKFVPELDTYFECTSNPILNADGKPELIVELLHDITERKRIEKAIFEANRKLKLLSSITRHDILNSLGGLLLFLDSIPRDDLSSEIRQNLDRILAFALTIKRQIEFTHDYEILGFEKAFWQDLSACFWKAVRECNAGSVIFEEHLAGVEIFADPMLEKVIYNLIDNALRYGGPALTTIRGYYRCDGDDLIWVIEDDGQGVDPDMKDHIMERGVGCNTGFGLFLSAEILSITGMTIRETGENGKGARFEIRVPHGMFRIAHSDTQGGDG